MYSHKTASLEPHTLKVLQELQGADSTVTIWFYKWFWEQGSISEAHILRASFTDEITYTVT